MRQVSIFEMGSSSRAGRFGVVALAAGIALSGCGEHRETRVFPGAPVVLVRSTRCAPTVSPRTATRE